MNGGGPRILEMIHVVAEQCQFERVENLAGTFEER